MRNNCFFHSLCIWSSCACVFPAAHLSDSNKAGFCCVKIWFILFLIIGNTFKKENTLCCLKCIPFFPTF